MTINKSNVVLFLLSSVAFFGIYYEGLATPTVNPFEPLDSFLKKQRIWNGTTPLRLHLGCGQTYFAHYINIDFPPAEHTVQQQTKADCFADITKLALPENSVDVIRSHHVFEHFERPVALSLLCQWYQWLKKEGVLIIETPDFAGSIDLFISPSFTYQEKQVIMRHVFGSHEARWAVHCDGWYKEKFEHVLQVLGFENITFELTQYLNLKNIIVTAQKKHTQRTDVLIEKAKQLLQENLVNDSEQMLWYTWCQEVLKVPQHIVS